MVTIGVDLGGTNVRAGIKEYGLITQKAQTTLHAKDSLSDTIDQVIDIIRPFIKPSVEGIGIAVPSVVDTEKGIVYNVVNIPSWEKVELKEILQDKFHVPVQVDNDANCFALGEHLYGQARNSKSVVGIVLGTGIGTGLIMNDRLYAGSNCGAGEIGYIPYLDKNIEFYCSSTFFSQLHQTTAHEVHSLVVKGDVRALQLWNEFGIHIGNAVKIVMYAYDPEVIVFGGSISKAFPLFKDALLQTVQDFIYPHSLERLKIAQSQDDNITLLGAAALLQKTN